MVNRWKGLDYHVGNERGALETLYFGDIVFRRDIYSSINR